jgi:hypothetical protein
MLLVSWYVEGCGCVPVRTGSVRAKGAPRYFISRRNSVQRISELVDIATLADNSVAELWLYAVRC